MYDLVVIGGGNLGHTMSAVMASNGLNVLVLTREPNKWSDKLIVKDLYGKQYIGEIHASNDFSLVRYTSHILFTLPGNALIASLKQLKPYINDKHILGSVVASSGFFWQARQLLGPEVSLYGFQRVPFISRIAEYGKSATITGYKEVNKIAVLGRNELEKHLEQFYLNKIGGKVVFLKNYLEAALTNSNPLLHTARMYSLFKGYQEGKTKYPNHIYLYREWDDSSSDLLIKMDEEFQIIVSKLGIGNNNFPSILSYYESNDAASLTDKIQNISAFSDILTPMIGDGPYYLPDIGSRIFQEDIPYGLVIIKSLGNLAKIATPNIDMVLFWSQKLMNRSYYRDSWNEGKDIVNSSSISNFTISNINELVEFR